MTDKTKPLSIRLNADDREKLAKIITRRSLESILRQIDKGEIEITENGINIGVNTSQEGVNTTIERISENQFSKTLENSGVNTDCNNCPYMSDLNMSGFDEVCEFKNIDRQKALDRCVQMLWR